MTGIEPFAPTIVKVGGTIIRQKHWLNERETENGKCRKKTGSDKGEFFAVQNMQWGERLEFLEKEFESANKYYYYLSFFTRLIWLTIISILVYRLTYLSLSPENFLEFKNSTIISTLLIILFSLIIVNSNKSIFSSHSKIVKQLEKRIATEFLDNNEEFRDANEDFYIQLKHLTKSRYEIYFKSVFYEFLIYAMVSISLSLFLIYKAL